MENKKTILTPQQKLFLKAFEKAPGLNTGFYFTGGTALAEFYLKHRLSEDLDFFSEREFDKEQVYGFINKIKSNIGALSVLTSKKDGRYIFEFEFKNNKILKVEFVHYPYKNLKPLKKFGQLPVNDEYDISVNKIFSVFSRNETKDFVDLYYLLKKYPLGRLLDGVEVKFGIKLSKFSLGNEFYKARNISILPVMIKKLSLKQLTDFFKDEARKLGSLLFEF